jgi:hypothetical protein
VKILSWQEEHQELSVQLNALGMELATLSERLARSAKLLLILPPAMALRLSRPIGAMVVATGGEDSRAIP